MPDTTDADQAPLARRLGWLVLLYLAGLLVTGGTVFVLRWLLGFVFPG